MIEHIRRMSSYNCYIRFPLFLVKLNAHSVLAVWYSLVQYNAI